MASAVFQYLPSPALSQGNPESGFRAANLTSEFEDVNVATDSDSSDTNTELETFEGMIGTSGALWRVIEQVRIVAATDSTVLLEGETGTGKELISRAVHNLSRRRKRNLVKFNCAAIPTGLLESELFGHERGAFTGSSARKIGRFELADKGTLFLDEVGEIPLELQVKLLRVLQEQEFERLGSTQTLRVNVRMVAATNRHLAEMVSLGEFRSDLYFRLNVFPITIPPLRQRREDIPLLAEYFLSQYCSRMGKQIDTIPASTITQLKQYSWPGNIRELQNFIERAVILTTGTTLRAPLDDLKGLGEVEPPAATLHQAESSHILKTLRETNWVLGGPRGAAMQLGLKRTTLISKMRKLGLSRPASLVAIR